MNLLITGALGYIGSHFLIEISKSDHNLVLVDNLINSKITVLDKISSITEKKYVFELCDTTNYVQMNNLFHRYKFDAIIHFSGVKAVGESVEKPLYYYRNNVLSTIVLAELCILHNVNRFVFSSSATVYGDQQSPLLETMKLNQTSNPYGETKAMSERILSDTAKSNPSFNVTLLRYFNPVGAHNSGLIGENPNGIPNNLMPYITKVAKGVYRELNVFGDDYDTIDGTGVRDYIHVVDLAKGHIAALENMKSGVNVYNLGTGKGISVLELISAFERVNEIKIPYKIVQRRSGDIAISYADASKAKNELNWEAKLTIKDMVRDSWNFEKNLK